MSLGPMDVAAPAGSGGLREITSKEFAQIRDFLFQRTGIELHEGKRAMVMGRLDRRLRHHGLPDYSSYLAMLGDRGDPDETRMAVDLLTTNETYFFREPAHFEFLTSIASAHRGPNPFRVWSAASSSGEEAYTIAMTLAEAIGPKGWEITGSDISTRVLETARRGVYPIEASEKIPRPLLKKYCLRGRDDYEGLLAIDPDLRANVTFMYANLLDLPGGLGQFDIIFLRNVMIYFGTDTKRDIVAKMSEQLRPGGHLIVSHSETLNGIQGTLSTVKPSVYRAGAADG